MRLDVVVLTKEGRLEEENVRVVKATAGIMIKAVVESNAKQAVCDWYSSENRETRIHWVSCVGDLQDLKSKLLLQDDAVFSEVTDIEENLEAISVLGGLPN